MTQNKITPDGNLGYRTRATWQGEKYNGLSELEFINPDGSKSDNIAIVKNGKIVNTMSNKYHVFSNVDLAEITDEIAKEFGAEPYIKDRGVGKWANQKGNILEDSKFGTRALITYKFPDLAVDITGAGDANIPTFTASNSEDGRGGALKILGGFERKYCDNLCFTFVPSREIAGLNTASHLWNNKKYQVKTPEIEHKVKQIQEAKADLLENQKRPKFFTKHSKQVKDLENIKVNIREAIEAIKVDNEFVANRYKELYKLKFNAHLAEQIVNTLPKSVYESVPALDVNKDGKITFDEKLNDWEVYNYLTEEATYNHNRTTTFGSTLTTQKKLENIFIRQPIEVLAS
jgi:hypothetical protein